MSRGKRPVDLIACEADTITIAANSIKIAKFLGKDIGTSSSHVHSRQEG